MTPSRLSDQAADMPNTKAFPTSSVLGVVTGLLLGDIGGLYEILGWMADDEPYTHQLPRFANEAKPLILALHPHLEESIREAAQVTTENWRQWLTTWTDRYGAEIIVPKMTVAEHERIEPISEAVEHFVPQNIIVVDSSS